jgi:daunorubicin resistance ABC transporter ATP-binding subunit
MTQSKTSDSSKTPAVAVEAVDVFKSYGAVAALGGVNLTVAAGTLTALLGPNGAGKTTLVRIIATLTRPDRGRVRVLGYDVADNPAQVRARIGLTGQYVGLDDALTGKDNLVLIGRLAGLSHRQARSRAADLAELLGVADALGRAVRTYSGGMRRRLDLAASLMTNPPLIVLDEPTTGLDPASRQQLWEALVELRAGGTTMLLTTQYLEEADKFADTVHVLSAGMLIASGTPAQLKGLVAGRVAEIRLDRPDDAAAAVSVLARKAALVAAAEPGSGRLTFPTEDGAGTLLSAVAALSADGIAICDLGLRQPSLDEAFLALTGPVAGAAGAGARP